MFGKKKQLPAAPVKAAKQGGSFSVIGADAVISGDVTTSENLQVDGRIDGDVRCGVLHLGQAGAIAGSIVAEEARLGGLVEGRVEAGLLILELSARVTGDISYETLRIQGGARVDGRFVHRTEGATVSPIQDLAQAAE